MLDRWWDVLLSAVPPAVLLLSAVALGMAPDFPWRLTAALGCVLAAVAYVAVLSCTVAVRVFLQLYRTLVLGRPDPVAPPTQRLLARHWSIALCHLPDVDTASAVDLLLHRLPYAEVLCPERVVTSPTGRLLLRGDRRVRASSDPSVLTIATGAPGPLAGTPPAPTDSGPLAFVPLYLFGVTVVLAVTAQFVAQWEAADCRGTAAGCADRPATYFDALYWLLNRLSGGDPEGLGAGTGYARTLGLLITLLAVFTVTIVFGIAGKQAVDRWAQGQRAEPPEAGSASAVAGRQTADTAVPTPGPEPSPSSTGTAPPPQAGPSPSTGTAAPTPLTETPGVSSTATADAPLRAGAGPTSGTLRESNGPASTPRTGTDATPAQHAVTGRLGGTENERGVDRGGSLARGARVATGFVAGLAVGAVVSRWRRSRGSG